MRQRTNPHCEAGWGTPVGRLGYEEHTKASETLPLLRVPQEHQVNNSHIYGEDLVQTLAISGLAASLSVSPYKPCLVDLVSHNSLWVSSIPSGSYHHSSPSFMGFPKLQVDQMETSNLHSVSQKWLAVCLYNCFHLMPKKGSLRMIGQGTDLWG